MPGSSASSASVLPVPARICLFFLRLLCLCLPKFVYFFYIYSACTWSLSTSSASALPVLAGIGLLPLGLLCLCLKFVCFLCVCFAYVCWSLLVFSIFALLVPRVCLFCLHRLCLCLCLICPPSMLLFFLYYVSAVSLFFKFYNLSIN